MDAAPAGTPFEGRLSELKEIKLKLPVRHHVSLHSLKLLRSESISDLVAVALEQYFAKQGVASAGVPTSVPTVEVSADAR